MDKKTKLLKCVQFGSDSGWRRVGRRMAYLHNGNFIFGKEAMAQAALDKAADEKAHIDSQPEHIAPDGVKKIDDTPEITQRRIDSGYILLPDMAVIPETKVIIRCGSCPWYRREDAFCFHEKNRFQCNGLLGCCNFFENKDAKVWK